MQVRCHLNSINNLQVEKVGYQAHPLQQSGLVETIRHDSAKLPMTSFVPTVRKGPLPALRVFSVAPNLKRQAPRK